MAGTAGRDAAGRPPRRDAAHRHARDHLALASGHPSPPLGAPVAPGPCRWYLSLPPPSVRSCNGGTGLEGNSRGNPVMGHGNNAGQAPDQANEGGQAGAGSARDMSDQRHAARRSGTQRVTRRHQTPTWQDPPGKTAGTCKVILTGAQRARQSLTCYGVPVTCAARSWPPLPPPYSRQQVASLPDRKALISVISHLLIAVARSWLFCRSACWRRNSVSCSLVLS